MYVILAYVLRKHTITTSTKKMSAVRRHATAYNSCYIQIKRQTYRQTDILRWTSLFFEKNKKAQKKKKHKRAIAHKGNYIRIFIMTPSSFFFFIFFLYIYQSFLRKTYCITHDPVIIGSEVCTYCELDWLHDSRTGINIYNHTLTILLF